MKKIISTIFILFMLFNCKNKQEESSKIITKLEKNSISVSSSKYYCDIPQNILQYINSNKNFIFLNDNDLNLIKEYIDQSKCPLVVKTDLNNNGKDELAIILRYNGYKNDTYKNYSFPFLIIFDDYESGINPNIIYKTGDYVNDEIKTVIYDQFEQGIFSYLEKSKTCDKNVINIKLPEKSTFFVYWNSKSSKYEFLNCLDENLCDKMNDKNINNNEIPSIKNNSEIDITGSWKLTCKDK